MTLWAAMARRSSPARYRLPSPQSRREAEHRFPRVACTWGCTRPSDTAEVFDFLSTVLQRSSSRDTEYGAPDPGRRDIRGARRGHPRRRVQWARRASIEVGTHFAIRPQASMLGPTGFRRMARRRGCPFTVTIGSGLRSCAQDPSAFQSPRAGVDFETHRRILDGAAGLTLSKAVWVSAGRTTRWRARSMLSTFCEQWALGRDGCRHAGRCVPPICSYVGTGSRSIRPQFDGVANKKGGPGPESKRASSHLQKPCANVQS